MNENGRDSGGRFTPGNQYSKGNNQNKRVAEWRAVFAEEVTPERFKNVIVKLLLAALKGEPWAIRECLARCLGTPASGDVQERLDELHAMAEELAAKGGAI